MPNHHMTPYQKETEIIEFSTRGPALAFACFTAGQIVRRMVLDEKDKKTRIVRNVGIAFECTGVGLLAYIIAPYISYYAGFKKR